MQAQVTSLKAASGAWSNAKPKAKGGLLEGAPRPRDFRRVCVLFGDARKSTASARTSPYQPAPARTSPHQPVSARAPSSRSGGRHQLPATNFPSRRLNSLRRRSRSNLRSNRPRSSSKIFVRVCVCLVRCESRHLPSWSTIAILSSTHRLTVRLTALATGASQYIFRSCSFSFRSALFSSTS